MSRLPNVVANYTHVNMLWHKEERVFVRRLISGAHSDRDGKPEWKPTEAGKRTST